MTFVVEWWEVLIIFSALFAAGFLWGWEAHRSQTWRRRLDRLKHPDEREYE